MTHHFHHLRAVWMIPNTNTASNSNGRVKIHAILGSERLVKELAKPVKVILPNVSPI